MYIADLGNARISQYTAWGFFVKAWGWDVAPEGMSGDTPSNELEVCGPAEPEESPPANLCQSGVAGTGLGQLNRPTGLAIDPSGDVYVMNRENFRVERFSPDGSVELVFGGDVNKTKVEEGASVAERNICPLAPSDVCQKGVPGEGPGQLSNTNGDYIAYSPVGGGAIVVGDKGGIQIFNLNGTHREEIPFESPSPLGTFADLVVNALDVDSAGNVYFSVAGQKNIYKLDSLGLPAAPGEPEGSKFLVASPRAVAVDDLGQVYAIESSTQVSETAGRYVLGFDPDGAPLDGMKPSDEFARTETATFPHFGGVFTSDLTALDASQCIGSEGSNLHALRANLFAESSARSYLSTYGSPPTGCSPPPLRAPVIVDEYVTSVGVSRAVLQAQINPRFWSDTTYHVQYGTGKCSEGKCNAIQPPLPGAVLTDKVINATLTTAGVPLSGLLPGTTYHYRFVAQSSGGGPAFGDEHMFRTLRVPDISGPCPGNESSRMGPSGYLPDCRAYEMVSPLEKGSSGAATAEKSPGGRFNEHNRAAPSGDRFTFSAFTPFAKSETSSYLSQYLAGRDPTGWRTQGISPPRTAPPIDVNSGLNNEFKGFSEDLCKAYLRHNSASILAPGAVPGYPNIYRRDNCAEPIGYAAATTLAPPSRPASEYWELGFAGSSEDGDHVLYTVDDALHPDAPILEQGETLLYEYSGGDARFVCYLPNGSPSPLACAAGTAGRSGRDVASLHNAISADGSRVFWTAFSGTSSSAQIFPGTLYVRVQGDETRPISSVVTSDPVFYWTAADDGSVAIFEVASGPLKGSLYEFDVDSQTATLIAEGVEGPLGASEDASRIYFSSTEDLDDAGPASKGAHNLYLHRADPSGGPGISTFVMALSAADLLGGADIPHPIDRLGGYRAAMVTPDGRYATFVSAASPTPTGQDNRDAVSGGPAVEVYRYDAETDELHCTSCNMTGARPAGERVGGSSIAARVPAWEMNLHQPRVITDDGSRVFFESFETLVPRDTNGTWDVYQWEEPGKGTCDLKDATYSDETGGCVDLISSGESKAKSTFLDADPSGDNIFFSTQSSLVGQDYGLNDVYVARVGGGFPEPSSPPICEGEACQSPAAAPSPPTPSSSSYRQPEGTSKSRRCPKGKRAVKRAGKVRCVKKRKGTKAGKRNQSRRAAR